MNASTLNAPVSVSIDDIEEAADRLRPYVLRTPLLSSLFCDEAVGGRLWLKAECLQHTGSFKLRGALNRLLLLSSTERKRGVVAFSSGNHAQGVAMAARLSDTKATIVMPSDAPAVKARRTRDLGAEIVSYDRDRESREAIAEGIAERTGATLVPPFDDPAIIAGQGTAGLEIAQDLAASGETPDQAVICCSGGGLSAGIGTALRARWPEIEIVVVEPAGYDDMTLSLDTGYRQSIVPPGPSLCDALLLRQPGVLTFDLLRGMGARGVTVTDDETLMAMKRATEDLHVVVEPGGAVALAACLTGRVETKGRRTIAVLSGGNVDSEVFRRALS